MPAARQRSFSPAVAEAVSAMIGTRSPGASACRIRRVAAKPSSRGICRSIRTASNRPPAARAAAAAPSPATSEV
jgi:hypothetical protein